MIRYPVTLDELRSRIEAEAPGWLDRAAERTERFRRAGRYEEETGIWNQIKAVYMRLQHCKCAYCERRLASEDFGGAIEHDLEHYRPKGPVPAWHKMAYRFSTGDAFPEGLLPPRLPHPQLRDGLQEVQLTAQGELLPDRRFPGHAER